jgi:hypothetical protein
MSIVFSLTSDPFSRIIPVNTKPGELTRQRDGTEIEFTLPWA